MKNFTLSAIFILLLSHTANSQVNTLLSSVLNTSGGTATLSNNFTIDWDFGESESTETYFINNPFPNSTFGSSWNLTSGFLQPYDKGKFIYVYPIPTWAKPEVTISPNPTSTVTYLKFKLNIAGGLGKITVQLMSMVGSILEVKEFPQVQGISTQMWNIARYPTGVYTFRITLTSPEGNIVKSGSFQIIKN